MDYLDTMALVARLVVHRMILHTTEDLMAPRDLRSHLRRAQDIQAAPLTCRGPPEAAASGGLRRQRAQ